MGRRRHRQHGRRRQPGEQGAHPGRGSRRATTCAWTAALATALAGCGLIGSGGEDIDAEPVEPEIEPVVTEVPLPGEYDGEGQHTSSWHLLPADGDVPALAAAISQVIGDDEHPVVALWHADTGDLFGEHTNLDAAGADVQELALGGDASLAVVGGFRSEGSEDVAFLLTSADRTSWNQVDLGEYGELQITAAGGSQDLVVAVDSSEDEHVQVVIADEGELDLITIAPDDEAVHAEVQHALVHENRVILSGHESAPGRADVAAIWVSEDRGRTFNRTEVDDEGSVVGVTRAGRHYYATGSERQGQWLRPRIWTSGNAERWQRYGVDYYQNELGWEDAEEDQGLSVPLASGDRFFAGMWSRTALTLKVVAREPGPGSYGVGWTRALQNLGVQGLAAPDGPDDYRILLHSEHAVVQQHWGDETRTAEIAEPTAGASVLSLIEMDEGTLVSTTRLVHEETDDDHFSQYSDRASYPREGSADWLPDGVEDHGARSVATQSGVRVMAGSGGSQWDRMPLWRQEEPGAPWTSHWIEVDDDRDGYLDDTDLIGSAGILATPEHWLLGGQSGRSDSLSARYATIWTSPDGKDWDVEVVLPGPDGTGSFLNEVCTWGEDLIAIGGYGHADGGDALGLWHRTGGDWDRIEVDDDWRGSLSYCRAEDGTLEVGRGNHWWTSTDLVTFTAGENEEADDDESWSSATVEFEDGWAYVTGTPEGVDLMVSTEAGQWDRVLLGLEEDLTGGVAAVAEDRALLFAERDTGRAWRIENVGDMLTERAALTAADDADDA